MYTRYSSGAGGGRRRGGRPLHPEDDLASAGGAGNGPHQPRSQSRFSLGWRSWLLVLLVLLIGVATLASLADYAYSRDSIHHGVTVYGIPVGGLSPKEAATKLAAMPVKGGRLVLTSGTQRWVLSPAELGAAIDAGGASEAAFRYSRSGGWLVSAWRRLSLWAAPHDVEPGVRFNQRLLTAQLDAIAGAVEVRAQSATVSMDGATPVVRAARTGVALDRGAGERLLVRAALTGHSVSRSLPIVAEKPHVSTAAARSAAAQARIYLAGPLALTYGAKKWRLTTTDLASYLTFVPQPDGVLKPVFDSAVLHGFFTYVSRQIGRPAQDASFRVSGTHVRVVPGKPGEGVAQKATERTMAAAAAQTGADRVARIVFGKTKPALTYAAAKAMHITSRIGTYTTSVSGTPGRLANVQLGAALLDGALVAPGKIFSVNETTGERTAAKGFQVAPVIVNGQLQDSVGGGMCQVSTTLFNAAFEAGLQIVERHNHSLYISHYPLGRDATVSYGSYDLRFRNDTKNWILVKSFYGGGYLTFSLYSAPLHRRVLSSLTGWYNIQPMKVLRQKTDTLPRGKSEVQSEGASGRSITCYRKVYDAAGKLIWNDSFVSVYPMYPEVLLVGTGPTPTPKPSSPSAGGTPTPRPTGSAKATPTPTP